MNTFAQAAPQSPHGRPQHRHRRSTSGSFGGSDRLHSGVHGPQPLPVLSGPRGGSSGAGENGLGAARSPPKNKNTSHVPCKFYLQGQCQAGRMCPFSHDIESTTRPAPCKYFAKGHCKFGSKCALLHITPDGIVVNRRGFAGPAYSGEVNGGYGAPPPGLLSLQAQGLEARNNQEYPPTEFDNQHYGNAGGSPIYGSSPLNQMAAASPPRAKILSVLDAPLPNSFDSNGISMAARNGPFAASMPSRFGPESPPSSLPRNAYLANPTLQDLHYSAFGGGSSTGGYMNGSSPPSGDDTFTFPKRSLLSDRFNTSRAMLSQSVGTKPVPPPFDYSDEEPDADLEENLLPASLRDLIPENRSRRESRSLGEDTTPASFLAAQRRTLSSTTTPQESKVGSPSFSSSPSRYSGMFAQRSMSSDFVGSPLRNSGFLDATNIGRSSSNTDLTPTLNSPPRQASMSMLTQELQRTKLDAVRHQVPGTAPASGLARTLSNGSNGRKSLERNLSSTSIGQRIDEEQEVFNMDEIGADSRNGDSSIGSRLFSQVIRNGSHLGAIGSQRVR